MQIEQQFKSVNFTTTTIMEKKLAQFFFLFKRDSDISCPYVILIQVVLSEALADPKINGGGGAKTSAFYWTMPCLILNLSARSLSGIVGLQKKYVDPNPSLSSKLIPNFSKDISILPSGNFTRNQKLACYALYLKIINLFFVAK